MLPLDLAVYTDTPRPKAADTPRKQDFAASAEDPKKLAKVKGSNRTTEAGFCCLCRRPDETRQDQRQQTRLKKQDFAAFGLGRGFFGSNYARVTLQNRGFRQEFYGLLWHFAGRELFFRSFAHD